MPVNPPPPPPPPSASPSPTVVAPAAVKSAVPPAPPATAIPPAPPAPPASYRVPLVGWILWGLYVVGFVGLALRHFDALTPYDLGQVVGSAVALLIFPTAISWVAWRIAGRSKLVGTIVWIGIFVLAVGGQMAQRARARNAAEQLALELERLRTEPAKPAENTPPAEAKKTPEPETPKPNDSAGDDLRVAQAMQAYVARMSTAREAFDHASAEVSAPTIWDLSQLSTAEGLAKSRRAVATLEATLGAMEELVDENGMTFGKELARFGVSPELSEKTLRGFRATDGERAKTFVKINALNRQLVTLMKSHLEFAEANAGKWRRDANGGLVFDDSAVAMRYQGLNAEVIAVQQQQAELQRQAAGNR